MLGSANSTNSSSLEFGFYLSLFSSISILVATVIFRSTTTQSTITYSQAPTSSETIIINDSTTNGALDSDKNITQ
jgi:hypothetical protein